jgi:hypothetical protein
MTEESESWLPGPLPAAATLARLLGGSEAASLTTTVPLALPRTLPRAGAGKAGAAVRAMPVAAVTRIAALASVAALAAAAARSHAIVAAATTAKLVARVVAAPA